MVEKAGSVAEVLQQSQGDTSEIEAQRDEAEARAARLSALLAAAEESSRGKDAAVEALKAQLSSAEGNMAAKGGLEQRVVELEQEMRSKEEGHRAELGATMEELTGKVARATETQTTLSARAAELQFEVTGLRDEAEENNLRLSSADAVQRQLEEALNESETTCEALRDELTKTATEHATSAEALKADMAAARRGAAGAMKMARQADKREVELQEEKQVAVAAANEAAATQMATLNAEIEALRSSQSKIAEAAAGAGDESKSQVVTLEASAADLQRHLADAEQGAAAAKAEKAADAASHAGEVEAMRSELEGARAAKQAAEAVMTEQAKQSAGRIFELQDVITDNDKTIATLRQEVGRPSKLGLSLRLYANSVTIRVLCCAPPQPISSALFHT